MYGAILGDMIGSPYEFKKGSKRKDFPFFDIGARFTDDTVMSIAVAEALMNARSTGVIDDEAATKEITVDMMHNPMPVTAAGSTAGSKTASVNRTTAGATVLP